MICMLQVTSYSTSDQFQVFLLLLLPHTFSKISRYKSLNYDYPPSSTSLAITISTIAYWWLMHWVFYIWYHIVTTVSERPYYFDITFMSIHCFTTTGHHKTTYCDNSKTVETMLSKTSWSLQHQSPTITRLTDTRTLKAASVVVL